jgi:hypothetical protein
MESIGQPLLPISVSDIFMSSLQNFKASYFNHEANSTVFALNDPPIVGRYSAFRAIIRGRPNRRGRAANDTREAARNIGLSGCTSPHASSKLTIHKLQAPRHNNSPAWWRKLRISQLPRIGVQLIFHQSYLSLD